jgi:hypothetical protein
MLLKKHLNFPKFMQLYILKITPFEEGIDHRTHIHTIAEECP